MHARTRAPPRPRPPTVMYAMAQAEQAPQPRDALVARQALCELAEGRGSQWTQRRSSPRVWRPVGWRC